MRSRDAGTGLGAGEVPDGVDRDVLAALVGAALDGLALLDGDGRYLFVNRAGCRILRLAPAELVGRPAAFAGEHGALRDGGIRIARWCRPGSAREQILEYRAVSLEGPDPARAAVGFRDVTEFLLQQRRFTAFAAAASNVAYAGSLRDTLDAICGEVVRTTDLAGAQILLMDPEGSRMQVHGAAPPEARQENFAVALEQVRRLGGELSSERAVRTGRPVVHRHRKAALLADPAWRPLHDQLTGFDWDAFVSVPLRVRDRPVGVLNAYYRPGHVPDDDEAAFLSSMADQAAVAVENARLLTESRGKAEVDERHRLARELHDSACQQLFSMTLHLRATQLRLPRERPEDEETRRRLQTLDELAHAALEDLRALVFELHPTLLHSEGLVAVVRQQAERTTAREGVPIIVQAPPDRLHIDADAELDALRLVQEALHNCVKHAEASSVRVAIGPDPADPATLVLEVADDGRGFDPARTVSGLGLVSMRQRAERLGGELTIASRPGAGTVVRAVVPRVLARTIPKGEP